MIIIIRLQIPQILYKETYNDTIFVVNRNFIQTPRYIINLGNRKLDLDTWRDCAFIGADPPSGYKVQSFVETGSFLILVLQSFKEPQMFAVYNKNTNSIHIIKNKDSEPSRNQVFLQNDLDQIIAFPAMDKTGYLYFYGNCLYSVIGAGDFTKAYKLAFNNNKRSSRYLKNMTPVFNQITEFSNPIIMKVHIK